MKERSLPLPGGCWKLPSIRLHQEKGGSAKNMYTLQGGHLVAVDPSGSPNRWGFAKWTLVTAPVVAHGTVFVGTNDGTVYSVSAATGNQRWSGTADSQIVGPAEGIAMAIGGGLLVVPAGNVLTAFGN